MKTKLFIMLALVLTMFAVSAKAQNPGTESCPEGSSVTNITTHPCGGGPVTIEVCWKCPAPGETSMTVAIIGGMTFATTPPPIFCSNFWSDIANELSSWANIAILCPSFVASLPPCSVPSQLKTVYFKVPLCWQYVNTAGTISLQTCASNTCECITEYEYCWDGTQVQKTTINHGIYGIPPNSCDPTTCPNPIYTIPAPLPGHSSTCGYLCQ